MQNLSKDAIETVGFDKIQKKILKFSNSKANHTYFKNLLPIKKIKDLEAHLSLSDIIYQSIVRKDDIDICEIADMQEILSKINIKNSYLSEHEFKDLYTILEANYKLKTILSNSNFKKWKSIQSEHTNKKWLHLIKEKFDDNFDIKSKASKIL